MPIFIDVTRRTKRKAPYPNPRKVGYAGVLELLREAFVGRRLG